MCCNYHAAEIYLAHHSSLATIYLFADLDATTTKNLSTDRASESAQTQTRWASRIPWHSSSPHCNSGTEYTLGSCPPMCPLLATHQERAALHSESLKGWQTASSWPCQPAHTTPRWLYEETMPKLISQRGVAPRGDSSCEDESYRLVEIETMAPPSGTTWHCQVGTQPVQPGAF